MDNRCMFCGEIIPEGMQICPTCLINPKCPNHESDTEDKRKDDTNGDSERSSRQVR